MNSVCPSLPVSATRLTVQLNNTDLSVHNLLEVLELEVCLLSVVAVSVGFSFSWVRMILLPSEMLPCIILH